MFQESFQTHSTIFVSVAWSYSLLWVLECHSRTPKKILNYETLHEFVTVQIVCKKLMKNIINFDSSWKIHVIDYYS